jgi:hypothetical protein
MTTAEICQANVESLSDIIKSLLIREGDFLGVHFRQYYEIGKDVYRDLNLYSIRYSKRFLIEVDKNTNSITLPDDLLLLSSVSVIDHCGQLIPLILNKNLTGEIIDINLNKDCDCKCNCKAELCGQLKHYEVVYTTISAPQPGGGTMSYNCYSRKTIYPNGDYYRQWNEPVAIYEAGVLTATELQEKTEFICKLEVKPCGCVEDNAANRAILNSCCGGQYLVTECCSNKGCPYEFPDQTYGYQQGDNRIYFNSNFTYTHALIRYYPGNNNNEIMIPIVAKTAMLRGIKFELLPYEKGSGYTAMANQRKLVQFERLYKEERKRLFRLLNRFSLKAFYDSIIPTRPYPRSPNLWPAGGPFFIPPNIPTI